MSESPSSKNWRTPIWYVFGSPLVGVALLALVVAALLATIVPPQNLSHSADRRVFSDFLAPLFSRLDSYDVTSSVWFLAILTLVFFIACFRIFSVWPKLKQDLTFWRDQVQHSSLMHARYKAQWTVTGDAEQVLAQATKLLRQRGFQTRVSSDTKHALLSARRGTWKHLGYLCTVLSACLLCLGGLLNSNAAWRAMELTGTIKPEVRSVSVTEVPPESRLPLWTPGFRGSVEIPESGLAEFVFVPARNGFLLQPLPFGVEVLGMQESQSDGLSESVGSELLIHDPELSEPLRATIQFEQPLVYRGYSIYQRGFSHAGTAVKFKFWPFDTESQTREGLLGQVNRTTVLEHAGDVIRVEFSDFRPANSNLIANEHVLPESQEIGPAVVFRVRQATGDAVEYINTLRPIAVDGVDVLLSGRRLSPRDDYLYLHIPVDPSGGVQRFMALLGKLRQSDQVRAFAQQAVSKAGALSEDDPRMQMAYAMGELVQLFLSRGFVGVDEDIQSKMPQAQRDSVRDAFQRILRSIVSSAYREVLSEEGQESPDHVDEQWLDRAVGALNGLSQYGAPFYLQIQGVEQQQSSGIHVRKSSGEYLLYVGLALLLVGLLMLLLLRPRRLWLSVRQDASGYQAVFVGLEVKERRQFAGEFKKLAADLGAQLTVAPAP